MNNECSLRDHKKAATHAAIYEKAAQLVDERGYDDVTVEDICTAVGISRRTLFYYVESKERAVLGPGPRPLTDAEREDFANVPPSRMLNELVTLWLDRMVPCSGVEEESLTRLIQQRGRAMMNHPQLAARRRTDILEMQRELVTLIADSFEKQGLLPPEAARKAEALTHIAASVMHMGYHRWIHGDNSSVASLRQECMTALADAIAIAKESDTRD